MALSTASTWPWCREPFSTISKASSSETSFCPLEYASDSIDLLARQFGQVASVRLRGFLLLASR